MIIMIIIMYPHILQDNRRKKNTVNIIPAVLVERQNVTSVVDAGHTVNVPVL